MKVVREEVIAFVEKEIGTVVGLELKDVCIDILVDLANKEYSVSQFKKEIEETSQFMREYVIDDDVNESKFFYDNLDGKYSFGVDEGEKLGTHTVFVHVVSEEKAKDIVKFLNSNKEEEDIWLYPEELGTDNILNVCYDESWFVNWYDLPDNWKDTVTNDGGKDGKPSIHDVMVER